MKIVAFAASNSSKSINKQLITFSAKIISEEIIPEAEIEILDINDYEMPIYSVDRQERDGFPPQVQSFLDKIAGADAILISFAENNAAYTTAYKNIFDWTSRKAEKRNIYQNKPSVYLSTSPSPRGGSRVLTLATNAAPQYGADLRGQLAIPQFSNNFNVEKGELVNEELLTQLKEVLAGLK